MPRRTRTRTLHVCSTRGTGNFGNLLFFWDVLFGSAHFTRQYPPRVGLMDDQIYGKERWFVEMFYPLLRSRRQHSALARGGRAYAVTETNAVRDTQVLEG